MWRMLSVFKFASQFALQITRVTGTFVCLFGPQYSTACSFFHDPWLASASCWHKIETFQWSCSLRWMIRDVRRVSMFLWCVAMSGKKKLNCISVRNRVIINKCTCSKPLKIIFSLHNAFTMCLTPFRIFSRAETNLPTVARHFHWQFNRPTASLWFRRLPLSESSIYLIEEVFY